MRRRPSWPADNAIIHTVRGSFIWLALAVCGAGACTSQETIDRFEDDGGTTAPSGGGVMVGPGGAGGVGGTGGAGGMGQGGVTTSSGGGPDCTNDANEPNDSEQQATDMGTIDDCNGSGFGFAGVLANNDVDWFSYDGQDTFGCSVDPSRSITADAQARVCKYFDCGSADEDVTCSANTQADTSPSGRPGCCGQTVVEPTINCLGTSSDDATVYLRIDKPSGFSCVSYSVDLHY